MRIYLACTVRGNRSGVAAARVAAETLRALGHEVLTSHLLEDGVDQAESALPEREVYERDRRWLDACDAVVAEASGSTLRRRVRGRVRDRTGRRPRASASSCSTTPRAATPVSRLISGYADPHGATCAYESIDDVRSFVERHFGAPAQPAGGI